MKHSVVHLSGTNVLQTRAQLVLQTFQVFKTHVRKPFPHQFPVYYAKEREKEGLKDDKSNIRIPT